MSIRDALIKRFNLIEEEVNRLEQRYHTIGLSDWEEGQWYQLIEEHRFLWEVLRHE